MTKKTKKFFLLTAGVLASLSLGLACVSCKKADPIKLVDFGNIEVTADLDGSYTLPIGNVTDENGKNYPVTFEVKTKSGKTITTFNNSFRLKYFEDYYIVCTTDLGGGDVRTRTITIKVKDTGAPVVSFGAVRRGIVDQPYTLPETTVEDSSLESLTASLKVFELNGEEKGKEMSVTDGKFTPERMGKYLIEATATDSNGNVGTETATMYAREAPEANEILSFKYEEDLDCVAWKSGGEIEWLNEYEGQSGVAKFSYTGNKWANAFSVLPLQDVSDDSMLYYDYDTLVVRMYIKQDAENTNYFTNMSIQDDLNDDVPSTKKQYQTKTKMAYNRWVDYRFDISALKVWDNDVLNKEYDKLWGNGIEVEEEGVKIPQKGEFYVAGIFLANETEMTVSANSFGVGDVVEFSTAEDSSDAVYELLTPDGNVQTLDGDTFAIQSLGVHTVNVIGDDYYGEAFFRAVRPHAETEVLAFDNESDVELVGISNLGSVEYVSEYEGETGVLQVNWTGSRIWPTISVASMLTQTDYAKFSHIVFRMYIPNGTSVRTASINNGNSDKNKSPTACPMTGDGENTIIVEGQWIDCKFSVRAISNWTNAATPKELLDENYVFWLTLTEAKAATFYIADIRMEKRVDVSVSGSTLLGSTVTIGAKADNVAVDLSTATITVTSPSGTATTLTGNTYTVSEKGEHTVVVSGKYYGTAKFTGREIGATEVLSFDYEEDKLRCAAGSGATIGWEPTFQGETGVLKVDYTNKKWPALSFQSYKTQADYSNYSRIVFKVWLPVGTGATNVQMHNTESSANHSKVAGTITEGAWFEIRFSLTAMSNWTDGATAKELFNNKCQFFFTLDGYKNATVYFADIYLA